MPQATEEFWKSANILIADDEPDMREIFAAWLGNLGCRVMEVADGKEALDALQKENFDAIVSDVRMPRVTGIELVRKVYDSPTYTPVIIFVSGFVDLPLPDAYELGVEAVLSKPCHRKELIGALRRSLQRRNLVFEPGEDVLAPAAGARIGQQESLAQTVAVGRGGISLGLQKPLEPGTSIGFSFEPGGGLPSPLCGWGVVRWCEFVSGRLRGGIEIMQLEARSLEEFARWLARERPANFIPKDLHRVRSSRA
jgi:two-component system response regulator Irr